MIIPSNATVQELEMMATASGIDFHPLAKAIIAKQEELIQELFCEVSDWKELACH